MKRCHFKSHIFNSTRVHATHISRRPFCCCSDAHDRRWLVTLPLLKVSNTKVIDLFSKSQDIDWRRFRSVRKVNTWITGLWMWYPNSSFVGSLLPIIVMIVKQNLHVISAGLISSKSNNSCQVMRSPNYSSMAGPESGSQEISFAMVSSSSLVHAVHPLWAAVNGWWGKDESLEHQLPFLIVTWASGVKTSEMQ